MVRGGSRRGSERDSSSSGSLSRTLTRPQPAGNCFAFARYHDLGYHPEGRGGTAASVFPRGISGVRLGEACFFFGSLWKVDKGERAPNEFAEAICAWREIIRLDSQGPISSPRWMASRFPILETMETLNNPARKRDVKEETCRWINRDSGYSDWRRYGEEQLSLFAAMRLSVNNIWAYTDRKRWTLRRDCSLYNGIHISLKRYI